MRNYRESLDDALLVVARLPNANNLAIGLNLVDIPPFDPNVLHHALLDDNRLLNDNRLLHNHGLSADRLRDNVMHNAPNHAPDKTRPEIASTAPPTAAMVDDVMNDRSATRCRSTSPATRPGLRAKGQSECRNAGNNDPPVHFLSFLSANAPLRPQGVRKTNRRLLTNFFFFSSETRPFSRFRHTQTALFALHPPNRQICAQKKGRSR